MYRKRKGKRFEDKVATTFQQSLERLTKVKPVDPLLAVKRSSSSGAAKLEKGDIDFGIYYQIVPYLVNVRIECKKWNSLTLKDTLDDKTRTKILKQIKRLYKRYKLKYSGNEFYLCFEGKRTKTFICSDSDVVLSEHAVYVYEDIFVCLLDDIADMLTLRWIQKSNCNIVYNNSGL